MLSYTVICHGIIIDIINRQSDLIISLAPKGLVTPPCRHSPLNLIHKEAQIVPDTSGAFGWVFVPYSDPHCHGNASVWRATARPSATQWYVLLVAVSLDRVSALYSVRTISCSRPLQLALNGKSPQTLDRRSVVVFLGAYHVTQWLNYV